MAMTIDPSHELFLDTSFAIALSSASDQMHARARQLSLEVERLKCRLVTTRGVLLEIGNSLARRRFRASAITLLEALH